MPLEAELAATVGLSVLYRRVQAIVQTRTMARMTLAQRQSLSLASTLAYERRSALLAQQVASGTLSPGGWRELMRRSIASHLLEQAILGHGTGKLASSQIPILNAQLAAENAYLDRFHAQLLARAETGVPWTAEYIEQRSKLYGGNAIAEFNRAEEARRGGEHADRRGWVVDYQSHDDEVTCEPCLEADADGPYLPGSGPLPGSVCRGGSRCRCRRVERYDLGAWVRLQAAA